MEERDIFDAIRQEGIDADDPEVRNSVRTALAQIEDVRSRKDAETARRCMRAVAAALSYELQHPDVDDMSGFESEFDDED